MIAIFLSATACWAAKRPSSDDELAKQATHIVTGKVIAVQSEIQNSMHENAMGSKDQIFTITVMVEAVRKGEKIKKGDQLVVIAWKPHLRMGIAKVGLQGHQPIPENGQRAEFFLLQDGQSFKPLMPNGMVIQP